MKINEKYNKFKFGKFFNELNMMTMENRRPFLPSYQMPQNDFKSYSKNLPFSLKPKIRPVSQEYPKVSFGKITKAGRFLKPIHYNDIASSSSSISSVSPFSPSYNTVSSSASAGQQVRNFTASRRPLQGPLSLSTLPHRYWFLRQTAGKCHSEETKCCHSRGESRGLLRPTSRRHHHQQWSWRSSATVHQHCHTQQPQ